MLKGYKATENPKEFIRIGQDEKGKESSRIPFHIDKQKEFAKELADFLDNNGVVEEAETEAEKAIREDKEKGNALIALKEELIKRIKDHEYHFIDGRHVADRTMWSNVFNNWYDQVDQVNAQIELMNEGKEFVLINIDPVPIFT